MTNCNAHKSPSLDLLYSVFDIVDAHLYWKIPGRGKHRAIGDKAGSQHPTRKYWQVMLDGVSYKMHRILYQMYHSLDSIPEDLVIDHVDGDPSNNHKQNLRLTTQTVNTHNSRKQKNNTSGQRGVSYYRHIGKWGARISHMDRRYFLGVYDTFEDACAAYQFAARYLRGDFGAVDSKVTSQSMLRYRREVAEAGVLPPLPEHTGQSVG